jgi:hypothetical protein
MAAQEIDRLIDPSALDEERQRRKRRLLKGAKEFRDVRGGNRPKLKWSARWSGAMTGRNRVMIMGVPDDASATPRTRDTQLVTEARNSTT